MSEPANNDELANMTRELWRNMDDDFSDLYTEAIERHNKKSGADVIAAIKEQQASNKTKPAAESE